VDWVGRMPWVVVDGGSRWGGWWPRWVWVG